MGKIYFLLVRIKIRYMELAIVRREITGAGILMSSAVRFVVYSKTCVKRPLSERVKIGFQGRLSLNADHLIPSLSYHLSLRSLFCLFLSGRFTHVLLYV